MTVDDAPRLSRSDLALLRRAARQRWGVPDRVQTEALFQALRVLTDPDASPRNRIAVVRTLVELTRADQADDRLELDRARSVEATSATADDHVRVIRDFLRDDDDDDSPATPPAEAADPC